MPMQGFINLEFHQNIYELCKGHISYNSLDVKRDKKGVGTKNIYNCPSNKLMTQFTSP